MKLLLINPRLPENFWSFSWAMRHVARDKKAILPPLGLATVAALTPADWEVRLIDENVEPIDWSARADVVGVCGMAVQFPRQKQIMQHFRAAGCHVVAGGSYASLCPEEYRDLADTVVAGEAEYVWPRFCDDFRAGRPGALYQETGTVDLADSPPPRYDLLDMRRYQSAAVQFSRGCPFRCEFCDIIVTFGRKPRTKSLAQIGRELDLLRAQGVSNVFFVDDNLIGHLPRCRELLAFLTEYQGRHGRRFSFGAEVSANVASQADLPGRLREANFQWVFVGIETPSEEALRETRKDQNVRADLLAMLRTLYGHGIDVYASFIIGFDADDATVFDRQYEFIMESGIVLSSIGLLLALPKTPLHERLGREGRLRPTAGESHQLWNNMIATNVEPLRMSYEEMIDGFGGLLRRVSEDASIARRIIAKLRHLGPAPVPHGLTVRETVLYLGRFLVEGLLRGGASRWWHFGRSLLPALGRPRVLPLVVLNWVYGIAIQSFVTGHLEEHAPRVER